MWSRSRGQYLQIAQVTQTYKKANIVVYIYIHIYTECHNFGNVLRGNCVNPIPRRVSRMAADAISHNITQTILHLK